MLMVFSDYSVQCHENTVYPLCHVMKCQEPFTTAGEMSVANLSLGSNIKLVKWAPQNDVLGHPAVQAFVTHAGINSLYEAAYHATPIVAVPLVADQPENAVKVHFQP